MFGYATLQNICSRREHKRGSNIPSRTSGTTECLPSQSPGPLSVNPFSTVGSVRSPGSADPAELRHSTNPQGSPPSPQGHSAGEPFHCHGTGAQCPCHLDLSLTVADILELPDQLVKGEVTPPQPPRPPNPQRSDQARTPSWGPQSLPRSSANA